MSPPRLTGALRSFSCVSKKEEQTEQLYDLKVTQDGRLCCLGYIKETIDDKHDTVETCAAINLSSKNHKKFSMTDICCWQKLCFLRSHF